MFESSAELGHRIDRMLSAQAVLREALLDIQYELKKNCQVPCGRDGCGGVDGAGKGETVQFTPQQLDGIRASFLCIRCHPTKSPASAYVAFLACVATKG